MTTATPPALHLVPKPCRYSQCTTGFEANPKTWPGDLGYCSDICRQFDAIEREVRTAMHRPPSFAGIGF